MRIDKDAYKRAVDETMEQMKSQEMYRRFVSLAGTSHLSARNLAAVLNGNPDTEEVGTLQYWNKRNRIVMAKSKGVKILKPDPDNPKEFIGGMVFDVKQTMASEAALQQGEKEYRHPYPYSGSPKDFRRFQEDFQRGISEVRVRKSHDVDGPSSLNGALITVNEGMSPDREAQAVLLEYARYVMGKNLAHTGETEQVNFDKEFKAITMASIMGKRMGFNMEDSDVMASNPQKVFDWSTRTESPDKLLSDAVNKANKALFQSPGSFSKPRNGSKIPVSILNDPSSVRRMVSGHFLFQAKERM